MKQIFLQALAIWVLFIFLAIMNAGLREGGFKPIMSELQAHQISTVTFIIMIAAVLYVWLRFTEASFTERDLVAIGLVWVLMTVIFEFAFGHFIMGHPWSRLFHDYNLLEGRIWSLVLLWTAVGPYIICRYLSWMG